MDHKGLADGDGQGLGALAEVAIDLNQQPLRIDRDKHSAGMHEPLETADRLAHQGAEKITGHLDIVGLNHGPAIKFHIACPDQARSLGRLGRRRAAGRGQFEAEGDAAAKSRDDPGPWVRRLTGNSRRKPDANHGTLVGETDRGRIADPSALIAAMEAARKLAISPIPRTLHPAADRREQPDEGVDEKNDKTEDDQFHHSGPQLSPR